MSFPKTQIPQKAPLPASAPVIDWIDRELTDAFGISKGLGGDHLLALRAAFSQSHPSRIITSFYRILPRLEQHHFLLGYRIRDWISLNIHLLVSDPLSRVAPRTYCIPQAQRTLPQVKNHFFEHAETPIPLDDIRISIRLNS